jgi:hypothetical protein
MREASIGNAHNRRCEGVVAVFGIEDRELAPLRICFRIVGKLRKLTGIVD